jgi:hypothetical protein
VNKKKGTARREAVVMNEASGFGHVEPLRPDQLKRLASDSPSWLRDRCATRTTDTTDADQGGKA